MKKKVAPKAKVKTVTKVDKGILEGVLKTLNLKNDNYKKKYFRIFPTIVIYFAVVVSFLWLIL